MNSGAGAHGGERGRSRPAGRAALLVVAGIGPPHRWWLGSAGAAGRRRVQAARPEATAQTVCEPALAPSPGAVSLLFPVADDALDTANPAALAAMPRPLPLVYVGNQYDRDEAFAGFFAPAAARHHHQVAGKWTRTAQWPHVTFTGRIAFPDVRPLYESALATILLLPDRYARAGQMTQRIFEAVLAGCLPLTPAALPFAAEFTPAALHVDDGHQAARRIGELQAIAGTAEHAVLIGDCIGLLAIFPLSRQLTVIETILRRPARVT